MFHRVAGNNMAPELKPEIIPPIDVKYDIYLWHFT